MPKKKKPAPDYWSLFHNEIGELCFNLKDGSNHKIILHGEGYKNSDACLKVLNDRILVEDTQMVKYFPPGEKGAIAVWVEPDYKRGKIVGYYLEAADREGEGPRIPISSPKTARKIIESKKKK